MQEIRTVLGNVPVPIASSNEDEPLTLNEQLISQEIAQRKDNREMRKEYAEKAYNIAVYTIIFWFCFVFIFLVSINKPISDVVFGIVTTACTVNILVAFITVVKGLFPHKE